MGKLSKIQGEIVKFTQQLVKIHSQNGIDSEKEIAKLIFKKLKGFGFSPKIIGSAFHPSVICYLKKPQVKKIIWLESCIDTVPAGDLENWQHPPFKGIIKGSRMYGRGVADSKIGAAIFCYLAKELYKDATFKGNIFLGFDADEQSGNFTGIREIVKHTPKADVCLLGYPGKNEISIGARGWLRLKLTVLGRAAHTGSRAKKGINAIHKMQKAIDLLVNLPFLKQTEKFFEYGASLNVASIEGGVAINIVPDECSVFIDIRFLLGQKVKDILREITAKLKELMKKDRDFRFKVQILQRMGSFITDRRHPFLKILKNEAKKILRRDIPLATSGAGSVGNLISKKNIPIVNGFGVDCGNTHASNEWADISDIPKIFEIYQKSLIQYTQ